MSYSDHHINFNYGKLPYEVGNKFIGTIPIAQTKTKYQQVLGVDHLTPASWPQISEAKVKIKE